MFKDLQFQKHCQVNINLQREPYYSGKNMSGIQFDQSEIENAIDVIAKVTGSEFNSWSGSLKAYKMTSV